MTNDQLTQEVVRLMEYQAQAKAEHEHFHCLLSEIQEEVKSTKSLAEDVHIMAINMKNMQETLNETNKKVDTLSNKEFTEYNENKKILKQNILSAVLGAIMAVGIGAIGWVIKTYLMNGGV